MKTIQNEIQREKRVNKREQNQRVVGQPQEASCIYVIEEPEVKEREKKFFEKIAKFLPNLTKTINPHI